MCIRDSYWREDAKEKAKCQFWRAQLSNVHPRNWMVSTHFLTSNQRPKCIRKKCNKVAIFSSLRLAKTTITLWHLACLQCYTDRCMRKKERKKPYQLILWLIVLFLFFLLFSFLVFLLQLLLWLPWLAASVESWNLKLSLVLLTPPYTKHTLSCTATTPVALHHLSCPSSIELPLCVTLSAKSP